MSRWRLAAAACLVAACGGDAGPGPDDDEPGPFSIIGGAEQHAPAGSTLPVPYTVRLLDNAGTPRQGVAVTWTVESGGGHVSPASSVTDVDGHASSLHSLGAAQGDQVVAARAGSAVARVTAHSILPASTVLVAEVPIAPEYGIHDTYVRDGIAMVFAWNTGVIIYDVGNGIRGGSPGRPVEVSRIQPPLGTMSGVRGFIHNGWWFHNPANGERRYLFVGQEAPGIIGATSRGDIFVVDVSDLARPVAVAQFGISGAGTHNFWVDEAAQVLYAAYYDAGIVALDVSGTLSGDLSSRVLGQVRPGGVGNTYTWGVQVANGSVYASDMLSGFWQLSPARDGLAVRAGGLNVPERFTSDLWVLGDVAFTGTWGSTPRRDSLGNLNPGDVVKIWQLDGSGAPVLASQISVSGAQTISDVEVSGNGQLLVATLERGGSAGFHAYSLANPFVPQLAGSQVVQGGLHTGTLGVIGGRTYLFAAKNPPNPALMVFDLTAIVP